MSENGSFLGGLFGGEPPPEMLAVMRARREAHFMHLEDTRNKMEGLFEDLPVEQLAILRELLYEIASAGPTAQAIAEYWMGWASAGLKFKHGVCSGCGLNHEDDALKDLVKEAAPAGDEAVVIQPVVDLANKFRDMTEEELQLMREYHLDDARVEGTNELVGFICTGIVGCPGGCGIVYPSIEDRMLRGPEDCHGCFNKAAHG